MPAFWNKLKDAAKAHVAARKKRLPFWSRGKTIDKRLSAASKAKAAAAAKAAARAAQASAKALADADESEKAKERMTPAFWAAKARGERHYARARR